MLPFLLYLDLNRRNDMGLTVILLIFAALILVRTIAFALKWAFVALCVYLMYIVLNNTGLLNTIQSHLATLT